MMKIMKASAGSGKTYNLSKTYIDLLESQDDIRAYRHILAVTFTNKATAEMKSRILHDLDKIADHDPKAKTVLSYILHDYSSFSVSTIDRFFQRTLKAFSREIGQFADYQIELDRTSLIDEAVDRILDGLTEDKKDLVGWIKDNVARNLELGRKVTIDEGLHDMGALLKSEEHRDLAERYGILDTVAYGKSRLDDLRKECQTIIDDFVRRAAELGLLSDGGERMVKPGVRKLKASAELSDLFAEPYVIYNTAWIIRDSLFSLGLADEFYKHFDALLREKNVMCLDESNVILRDIIDGSDAPFVYEKLGVRFDNFLMDEFQDTSNIQWDNFLPLLRESESNGGRNLIVGDVKQSIYRWRDSDWNLLGSQVQKEFPKSEVITLQGNWRSSTQVVAFNNGFFAFAAEKLSLQDLYADVKQEQMLKDEQSGSVELTFTDDQQAAILDSIHRARVAGAEWRDIAILVRNRRNGAEVADYLIGEGIPVISDDSLNLKSSVVVRRLVSLLSLIDNPEDTVSGYLAATMGLTIPDTYHSLIDLCESLLRSLRDYDRASFDLETLFIQAFMDDLHTWVASNGNNISYYLRYWGESELFIGTPENAASVRILTIHKAKGLEFQYLIFPYADKVDLYKAGVHWCRLEASPPFSKAVEGIYPLSLNSHAAESLFRADYEAERSRQLVDNVNVFYVALTRACKCLHVIAKGPSKKCRESIGGSKPAFGNFSELLYHYVGGRDEVTLGEMYDFGRMVRKEASEQRDFAAVYPSIPLAGRLVPSADASDFFGEGGDTGVEASSRLRGIVLHDILSAVHTASDLDAAVDAAVRDGRIDAEEGKEAGSLLSARIAGHPEWFRSDTDTLNEVTMFAADGSEHRPDRVIVSSDGITVIDFKFGREDGRYLYQLRRYASLFKALGYDTVSAYIWYIVEDKVIVVI